MMSNREDNDQNENTLFIDGIFEETEKEKFKSSRFQEIIPQKLQDLNQSGIAKQPHRVQTKSPILSMNNKFKNTDQKKSSPQKNFGLHFENYRKRNQSENLKIYNNMGSIKTANNSRLVKPSRFKNNEYQSKIISSYMIGSENNSSYSTSSEDSEDSDEMLPVNRANTDNENASPNPLGRLSYLQNREEPALSIRK